MHVYWIARDRYPGFDGEGARLNGGRWNSVGIAVVYTSTSRSLAALEYLVHIDITEVPDDLVLLTIEVPDTSTSERIGRSELPDGWQRVVTHPECRALGDAWARTGRDLMLRVPAGPVPEEENVLLNPRHADALHIRVVDKRAFLFDRRLLI